MPHFVIGLDLGTSTCKAVVLDENNRVVFSTASAAYSISSPEPGWAVEEPDDIWRGVLGTLKSVAARIPANEITGICLSGAMHSLFPIDKSYRSLASAMTWADNRSAAVARRLRLDGDHTNLLERSGCPLQHVYNPARLRWWMETYPEITQRAMSFISIKDWIGYRLAGRLVTDIGLASTTGMLDIRSYAWDEEALELSGVNRGQLPDLIAPEKVIGGLTEEVSTLTDLPAGLPVLAGTSDGGLANLGSGAFLPGQRIITVGTSGAVRQIAGAPWVDPLGRTWCYSFIEGSWFIGGAINNGGLALQWVLDRFYSDLPGDQGYLKLIDDASSVAPGSEGVTVLPFFTGERSPYWNPDANAIILGLDLRHHRGSIARATMEGVAFCIANIWEILNENPTRVDYPVYLTGGINKNPLWSRILADVLGQTLIRIDTADASAIGAGILGNWASGITPALGLSEKLNKESEEVSFDPNLHVYYSSRHAAFKELYRILESSGQSDEAEQKV